MARHIHADLIIAWANGAIIQYRHKNREWRTMQGAPCWIEDSEYRIKPKETVKVYKWVLRKKDGASYHTGSHYPTLEAALVGALPRDERTTEGVRLDWTMQEREVD